jgi:hypothetical protein
MSDFVRFSKKISDIYVLCQDSGDVEVKFVDIRVSDCVLKNACCVIHDTYYIEGAAWSDERREKRERFRQGGILLLRWRRRCEHDRARTGVLAMG